MMPRGSGTRWPPSPLDRRSGHSPAPAQLGRPVSLRHRHLATSPPRQAQVLVHSVPGPSSGTWLEEQNWADWSHLLIGCKHKWYHLERYPLPASLVPALSFRSQGPASLLSPPAFLVLPTSHLNTYPSPPAARKDPQVPDPRSGSYPLPQSGTLLPQITPLLPPGTCINAKQGVVPPALRTGIRHNPANPGSLRFPTTGQSQPPRPHRPAVQVGPCGWSHLWSVNGNHVCPFQAKLSQCGWILHSLYASQSQEAGKPASPDAAWRTVTPARDSTRLRTKLLLRLHQMHVSAGLHLTATAVALMSSNQIPFSGHFIICPESETP